MIEADIGDVGAPHLIDPLNRHAAQQVRVDFVRRMRAEAAGVGAGGHGSQSHAAHQPLHALSVHGVPATPQKQCHAPSAVERARGVLTVNELTEYEVIGLGVGINNDSTLLRVHGGARHAR